MTPTNAATSVVLAAMCVLGCSSHESDPETLAQPARSNTLCYLTDVAKGFVAWYAPRGPATERSPVWGSATRNGQPLSSGQITLIPTETSRGTASGLIASDGTYVLYSGTSGLPGVEPGTYTVHLTKDCSKPTDDSTDDLSSLPTSASLTISIRPGPQQLVLAFD